MIKVKEDLSGKKFGKLTVIKQVEDHVSPSGVRYPMWLCECNCKLNNQVIVSGQNLKSGKTKSCGCLNPIKAIMMNRKYNKYDITSHDFGILWTLNTNEEVYFDLEDADSILNHYWNTESSGYPYTMVDGKPVRMHVFLNRKWHDHHNKNKMDNRKENLIYCTHQENIRNSSISKNNKSGITGVYFSKDKNKWIAQITINGKTKSLGSYSNKTDAIRSRLIEEKIQFGEFAPQRHLFEEYGLLGDDYICEQ